MWKTALFTILSGALCFAGCAQTRAVKTKIHDDRRTGVILQRRVDRSGVPVVRGYSHPSVFKVEDLKYLLGTVMYQEKTLFGWSEARHVFTADELYRMTPYLVEAFDKATPDDEVIFDLTTAKRGAIFYFERFTDGSMYVKDGKLNVLFSNVDSKADSDIYDGPPRKYYAGGLWSLIRRDWQKLVEDEGGLHYNWIELDIESGLAEKKRVERVFVEKLKRQRATEQKRKATPRPEAGWEEWRQDSPIKDEAVDEDVEDEAVDEDVYFPDDSP